MVSGKFAKVIASVVMGAVLTVCAGANVKAADAYYVDAYGMMHEASAEDANSTGGLIMAYDIMPNWSEMLDFSSYFEFPVLAGTAIDFDEFVIENEENLENGIQAGFVEESSNDGISMEDLEGGVSVSGLGMWDPIQSAIMMHHMAFFNKTGMWLTEY